MANAGLEWVAFVLRLLSKMCRKNTSRPCPVWSLVLPFCFFWQPVSGTIRRLQEGTMEASGRTPTSPTRRVQTVIQVSTQHHRTSALWEQGNLTGVPLKPAPLLVLPSSLSPVSANPIMGSSAKPIELSGWQLGSS